MGKETQDRRGVSKHSKERNAKSHKRKQSAEKRRLLLEKRKRCREGNSMNTNKHGAVGLIKHVPAYRNCTKIIEDTAQNRKRAARGNSPETVNTTSKRRQWRK